MGEPLRHARHSDTIVDQSVAAMLCHHTAHAPCASSAPVAITKIVCARQSNAATNAEDAITPPSNDTMETSVRPRRGERVNGGRGEDGMMS